MRNTLHFIIISTVTFISMFATQNSRISAQNISSADFSLSVSPSLVEVTIQPGKKITQAFTLQNTGDKDLEITPAFLAFTPKNDQGEQAFAFDMPTPSYAKLFNQDKQFHKPFVLKKGQRDQVILLLQIPENFAEKDLYHTMLFQTKTIESNAQQAQSFTKQSGNVGINMLISISKSGENQGKLRVSNIQLPTFLDSFFPIKPEVIVENIGSMYTKAEGEVTIDPIIGEIKTFAILPENILAHSSRKIHASLPNPQENNSLMPSEFEVKTPFALGPTKVTVTLRNSTSKEQSSQTVFSFPFVLIGGIIISVGIAKIAIQKSNSLFQKHNA